MSTHHKKLVPSAVSSEFVSYRNLLAGDLKRSNLVVAVQEDFVVTGGKTLEKLDTYIRHCDAVIHLVGKAAGAVPEPPAVAALLAIYPDFATRLPPLAAALRQPQPGISYTQWEAYLAMYHGRPLFVYRPMDFELDALHVPRNVKFIFSPAEAQSQKEHYGRIAALGSRSRTVSQRRAAQLRRASGPGRNSARTPPGPSPGKSGFLSAARGSAPITPGASPSSSARSTAANSKASSAR